MDSSTGKGVKDSRTGIEIDSHVAYSAIILSDPSKTLFGMSLRLRVLGGRYNFGDDVFSKMGDGSYSENLNRFWGELNMGGYADSDSSHLHLNTKGTKFLEQKVLRSLEDNPEALEEFFGDVGLSLDPISRKHDEGF